MPNLTGYQISQARELFSILLDISRLLNTGLEPEVLTICIRLCEAGVNPDAMAMVIKELQKAAVQFQDETVQAKNV